VYKVVFIKIIGIKLLEKRAGFQIVKVRKNSCKKWKYQKSCSELKIPTTPIK